MKGLSSLTGYQTCIPCTDPVEQIASAVERAPEMIEKIKALFKKKQADDSDAKETTQTKESPEA